jgi:glyoxylase-like metal-dependent hydrolase (beta-lactamase superfamily II)
MRLESLVVPPLDNDVYLLLDEATKEAAVIDVGLAARDLQAKAQDLGVKITTILNTHGHADHTADDASLKEATGAKLGIFEVDAYRLERNSKESRWFLPAPPALATPDLLLKEGTEIKIGGLSLRTLHTPGHTEGSCCFHIASEGLLFSGDTLFAGSCGRTDVLGGSPAKMVQSLRRLYTLPADTRVLPGHGPETVLGRETWIENLAYPIV